MSFSSFFFSSENSNKFQPVHFVDSLKSLKSILLNLLNLFTFYAIDLLEKLVFVSPGDKNGLWWKKDHWVGDQVTPAQSLVLLVTVSMTWEHTVDFIGSVSLSKK